MTNNDKAWGTIFDELKILKALEANSYYPITAAQINSTEQREARLMAKLRYQRIFASTI